MLDWEEQQRARRSLERRLSAAHIGRFKPLCDFDWTWPKQCDRAAVDALITLDFLKEAANVVFVGPNGVGKSMFAQNIAHQAVIDGHTVLFTSAGQLLGDLCALDSDSTLQRRLRHYARLIEVLLSDRHRDEPRAPLGIPPTAATDRGLAAIDRRRTRDRYRHPRSSTLSRRGVGLTILPNRVGRTEPLHLLIDSTGLKIYGDGEWLDQKHGIRSRRRWRKLHLAVDAGTHEIVAVELTPDDVGDIAEVPDLLDQIGADVASMTADGAYDGKVAYDAVAERHPKATVIIPPRIHGSQPLQMRRQSRSVTNISRPSQSMDA